jgi:hypothetical protein
VHKYFIGICFVLFVGRFNLLTKNGGEIWIVTIKNKSCFQLFLFWDRPSSDESTVWWNWAFVVVAKKLGIIWRNRNLACCGWQMIVLLEVAGLIIIICNFVLNWEQLFCWSKFWFHKLNFYWFICWFLCSLNLNLFRNKETVEIGLFVVEKWRYWNLCENYRVECSWYFKFEDSKETKQRMGRFFELIWRGDFSFVTTPFWKSLLVSQFVCNSTNCSVAKHLNLFNLLACLMIWDGDNWSTFCNLCSTNFSKFISWYFTDEWFQVYGF